MIYCINQDSYPKEFIEELIYKDENGFEWHIRRTENGLFIRYFGEEYFQDKYFDCKLQNGNSMLINNTNCIFIQDCEFETFAEIREVLKNGYTDEIWEVFEEMFAERFDHCLDLNEWEKIK